MAVAPRAKKRSPAQIAAGKAFAAAGRAAQASARAAAIKKTGKPPPRSKAQQAAAKKFAAAGQAALAARRAGKTPVTAKNRAAAAPGDLVLYPGSAWPTGCNDVAPTCAAVAVASHLQAVTGFTMPDADILKLHAMAGGENGATIENVLGAMQEHWLKLRTRVRLLSFFPVDEQFLLAGMVVGVRLGHEGHAVVASPGGMISWGREMAWAGEPEEAWALEWGY